MDLLPQLRSALFRTIKSALSSKAATARRRSLQLAWIPLRVECTFLVGRQALQAALVHTLDLLSIQPTQPSYGGVTTLLPSWGIGNTGAAPSGQCEVPGALYSYTGSSGGSPLRTCLHCGFSLATSMSHSSFRRDKTDVDTQVSELRGRHMRRRKRAGLGWLYYVVGISLAIAVVSAHAQSPQNWNAVVQSSSGTVNPSASYAMVDATQYTGDICAKIDAVFTEYLSTGTTPTNAVVVDARGVPTPSTCSVNPWNPLLNSGNQFANTVLLPPGTITISASWILPNRTHLIGQGPNSTVIKASSGSSAFDMIDMGEESPLGPCVSSGGAPDCPDIEIEHLELMGNGHGMGIVNCCAQELSRVNDVSMTNVTTGLALTDQFSENSGPYTNLTISAVNTCLSIGLGPTHTGVGMVNSRGVHGLTCTVGGNSNSQGAILLDGPDNELEDIAISSSTSGMDGVRVGFGGPAEGNTLINILGGTGLSNVIHISNATTAPQMYGNGNCPYSYPTPGTVNNVCDLTILGVSGPSGTNTLRDDLTITTITDSSLGMYTTWRVCWD